MPSGGKRKGAGRKAKVPERETVLKQTVELALLPPESAAGRALRPVDVG